MNPARCLFFAAGVVATGAAAAQSLDLRVRASEILGREVTTPSGERLAIRDLVINPVTGKVEFFAVGRADEPDAQGLQLYPIAALRSFDGGRLAVMPENGPAVPFSFMAPSSR